MPSSFRNSLRRGSTYVLPGCVLLACLVSGWQTYASLDALDEAYQYQDYAIALRQVLVDCLEAETGQRGYLLTGDEAYLEPYRRALVAVPANLKRARCLAPPDEAA